METRNSQKKSRRSSAKSEKTQIDLGCEPSPDFDLEQYMHRSFDHVARVRAAKEAAQRAMEAFGDVSEYDISTIQGQLKQAPVTPSQPALDFPGETQEAD